METENQVSAQQETPEERDACELFCMVEMHGMKWVLEQLQEQAEAEAIDCEVGSIWHAHMMRVYRQLGDVVRTLKRAGQ